MPREKQLQKVESFITGLACLFDEKGCSDEAVRRVVKRSIQTEFKGTAYSPLPDIGALSRVIDDVLRDMVTISDGDAGKVADQEFLTSDQVSSAFADFWKRHA